MRVTYDMQPNEHRLQDFMEEQGARSCAAMGAEQDLARAAALRGVVSSHDLGGARMGDDPRETVVDRDLQVHDTPGLYVFGTAVFPTCVGINPHLTLMAITARASRQLIERLGGSVPTRAAGAQV